ncbi:MAG: hypothetical protein UX88_C0003G0007 [Candidatus Woesebacteria bacterium GW2011_GWC2_47_16]|uniref:Uncharacterized protein n=8 Tax=Candidatus Woeseibacteriota TaxID=1752722 RepID=A0A0G1QS29_9BACT|nr:MAG: hypothetical protein UX03_C0004G0006 [Candidatus Woesebacteria bacterium GW2011_GWE1_45_18]KKU25003.1 MAG: hypothetical protein UX34_C0005G0007 [Candidatus Woesebacteria bacterium GW2011_GWF1_46_13]KKU47811.1 MAG: hypothetical protein UX67_C0028G0004 [Candidatus Woesebacteria bacterium GW2011_GWF2_46_8]KKU65278.1 MAG: hypothetical protein UX88_C0003G0007 [Candidatus Woesebacteria bacterium GW2011_GWC2_47_16]KKU70885.1 MAG: hypothetical protein UX95_C0011G0017 [Candidatus Woesebacteria b
MGTVLITSLLGLQLLLAAPFISQATSSPAPRRQLVKEEIQVRNEERRATITARLTEIRRERIRNYFNRLVGRLEAAIARLEKLITRIESRIAKIEELDEEIDTAPITEQVNAAKSKLAEAEAELQEVKDVIETLLAADNPQEVFETVREKIMNIKDSLIEVHRILVHVIGDLKGLRVGPTASPGTSPLP